MADNVDRARRRRSSEQLASPPRRCVDAMSPANFPLTNPVVLERTLETKGENLVKGMEHLAHRPRARASSPTPMPTPFKLGENIAATPGQGGPRNAALPADPVQPRRPTRSLAMPLVIFPPWINRFYILDLNPRRASSAGRSSRASRCSWSSWKSADASMARRRVGRLHPRRRSRRSTSSASGSACRRPHDRLLRGRAPRWPRRWRSSPGAARRTRSRARRSSPRRSISSAPATSSMFIDDGQIEMIGQVSQGRLSRRALHGRDLQPAARPDLIWNYVVNNYLLGEDYPAFDLLHWNGDVTNLPAKWHERLPARPLPRQPAGRARRAGGRRHADRPHAGSRPRSTSRPGARITSPRPKACGG